MTTFIESPLISISFPFENIFFLSLRSTNKIMLMIRFSNSIIIIIIIKFNISFARKKKERSTKLIVSHDSDKFTCLFSPLFFYRKMRSSDIPLSQSRVVNSLEPYPITRSSVPMFLRTLHLYPGKIIHLSGHVMRNKPMNFIKISDRLAPGFPGQRLRNFKKTNRRSVVPEDWIASKLENP